MNVQTVLQSKSASEAIVDEVADREGVDPTDLTPLFEAVDPDALDRLVESADAADDTRPLVEFTYHGYEVSVSPSGVVSLDRATPVLG